MIQVSPGVRSGARLNATMHHKNKHNNHFDIDQLVPSAHILSEHITRLRRLKDLLGFAMPLCRLNQPARIGAQTIGSW